MPRKRNNPLLGGERAFPTILAMLTSVAILSFLTCSAALAQSGGTAACVCYCGINLRPPCGDDACKRACGWTPPSTGATPGGGAGGAIGGAISSGITNAINQSRARAEQERQRALQEQQRALQENQQMMQALDEMSRENVRQGDELLRKATEQARQLDDQSRQEALSALKGIPQADGEISLKPATDFFGITGNPKSDVSSPVDASVVDLRRLDPDRPITVDQNVLQKGEQDKQKQSGTRIMDCEQGRNARDRLVAGLPVQQEAIKRSEGLLEAAGKDVGAAKAESKQVLLQGAIQEAKGYAQDVLTSVKGLRSQVEMLNGLDKATRDMLIRTVNAVAWGGEDLYQAGGKGYEAGVEIQKKAANLSDRIATLTDKLLMESGIAEKVGEELSGKLWGPIGQLGFRGAKLSIDLSVALGSGIISKADQQTAQRNLDIMRSQYERAKTRISELDRDIDELCRVKAQARQ
jgi:hypothetical protein